METRTLCCRTGLGLIVCLWLWSCLQGTNEYLSNAIQAVWFLSAPALVAAKLRWPRVSWVTLWMLAAAGSWVLLNLAVSAGPAPRNAFGAAFVFLTGWFYLLPVFGFWTGIYWLMAKKRTKAKCGISARSCFPVLIGISAAVMAISLFMWTPRSRVEAEARRIARDEKLGEVSGLQSHRVWRGWVVDLDMGPKGNHPVFFSRGGKVTGWGEA